MADVATAGSPARRLATEVRRLLALALPLALVQAGQNLMGVVDTAVLGHHGEAAMAGSGIGNSIFFAVHVIGLGILLGLDTLVPQALGAGRPERAHRHFRAGLRLAALIAAPLSLVMVAIALALPHAGLRDPQIAAEARAYLLWRVPGLYPTLVVIAQRSYLQAHGRTGPLVLYAVAANLVNLTGDYVLVFGDGGLTRIGLPSIGLPALGSIGAALATTLVSVVGALLLALWTRPPADAGPPPDRAELANVFRVGLPIGLHLFAEVGVFGAAGFTSGLLPGHGAAGHQLAMSLASLSFSLAVGVGGAAAVRVGLAVGAGDHRAARRAGTAAFIVGMALMGSSGVVFAAAPLELASLFSREAHVVAAAAPLIQIAAVFQLSDALQAVGAGALRGAGDTAATFVANLVGHYGVGLPVGVLMAFPLGLGAAGLWWGLTAGLTAVAVFLVARFYRLTSRTIAPR